MAMTAPRRVVVLGATGSIGRQTLDIVASRPDLFELAGMSAHTDEAGLLDLAAGHPRATLCLSGAAPRGSGVALSGNDGLHRLVADLDADLVVNGIAGAAGLRSSFVALETGKHLALANKETMVMAGRLALAVARDAGLSVLPVDSEHSAVWKLLRRLGPSEVEEIVLTASGGALRDKPLAELDTVTPEEALAHPTWRMGGKITIDSATMANKGLEVIEAARLFGMEPSRIRVAIHPQSLVHSLVRSVDGALYAQVSRPDMRAPIWGALVWPAPIPCPYGRLELAGTSFDFRDPAPARYPLLGTAYGALADGEGACIAYNAADEIAVAAFVSGRIRYPDIHRVVDAACSAAWPREVESLDHVLELDARARERAAALAKGSSCS